MTGTTGLTLRHATAADMKDVHAIVLRAGLGSGRHPAALEFYRTCPGGQLIVACQDDRVTGVSCAVSFGRTGWIGNVAVDPEARGRGLGTAVSQAALDALRTAGATGEDRGALLSTLADRVRVPANGAGYRLSLPWGGGPVIASTEAAATSLLTDLVHTDPEPRLAFPEPNALGAKLAASLGFQQVRRIPRMRLGPPVPGFRPERIFNVFSFAVG